jgi:hypothetical protein
MTQMNSTAKNKNKPKIEMFGMGFYIADSISNFNRARFESMMKDLMVISLLKQENDNDRISQTITFDKFGYTWSEFCAKFGRWTSHKPRDRNNKVIKGAPKEERLNTIIHPASLGGIRSSEKEFVREIWEGALTFQDSPAQIQAQFATDEYSLEHQRGSYEDKIIDLGNRYYSYLQDLNKNVEALKKITKTRLDCFTGKPSSRITAFDAIITAHADLTSTPSAEVAIGVSTLVINIRDLIPVKKDSTLKYDVIQKDWDDGTVNTLSESYKSVKKWRRNAYPNGALKVADHYTYNQANGAVTKN